MRVSHAVALPLLVLASLLNAAERPEIRGKVTTASGEPLQDATVFVYQARVRSGYSLYCPTCYPDCGKRALTDSAGNYSVGGLSPDLLFDLLVVKDGYAATLVRNADPAKGPAETAALKTRTPPADPSQSVRGRIVDRQGEPVARAVVEPQGAEMPDGGAMFGGSSNEWIDLIAVTGEKGEFEVAFRKPAARLIMSVSPRNMASKVFTLPTGADRKTLTVSEGATVRGRLVRDGKPVANAEIGLLTHANYNGLGLPEMRIGTGEDGTFAIGNVPAGRIWYLYGKMASLAPQGLAAELIECETKDDGEVVNLGEVRASPAYTLRGRVALSDGKPIPPDMRLNLFADNTSDAQTVVLERDGNFEFKGLAGGVYNLSPSVKGYKAPEGFIGETLVKRDVEGLILTLRPDTGRP